MRRCLPVPVATPDLDGLSYFRRLGPWFAPRHAVGTARDRAGHRPLLSDQDATVLLLSLFNPTVTSVRGRQQTTTLAPGPAPCGLRRTAVSARSAAAAVCDAAWRPAVLTARGAQRRPPLSGAEHAARASLPAVDGRLGPAVPRRLWAVWQDDQQRAAKRPVACAVRQHGPVPVTVTAGHASERAAWRRLVPPGGVSVFDRGDADDDVLQELQDLPGSLRGRVQENTVDEIQEERPIPAAAQAAGVQQDVGLRRLGTAHHFRGLPQPFRVVRGATGKTDAPGTPEVMVWGTQRLDRDADLVALA